VAIEGGDVDVVIDGGVSCRKSQEERGVGVDSVVVASVAAIVIIPDAVVYDDAAIVRRRRRR
jgi:hypothetical protein